MWEEEEEERKEGRAWAGTGLYHTRSSMHSWNQQVLKGDLNEPHVNPSSQ